MIALASSLSCLLILRSSSSILRARSSIRLAFCSFSGCFGFFWMSCWSWMYSLRHAIEFLGHLLPLACSACHTWYLAWPKSRMTAAMLNTAMVGRRGRCGRGRGGRQPGCAQAARGRCPTGRHMPATPSAADNNANVRFTPSPPLVRGRPARVPVLTGHTPARSRGLRGRSRPGDLSPMAVVALVPLGAVASVDTQSPGVRQCERTPCENGKEACEVNQKSARRQDFRAATAPRGNSDKNSAPGLDLLCDRGIVFKVDVVRVRRTTFK